MTANKNHAKKEARRVLKEFNFSRIPIPVDRVAKKLGAKIRYSPMDSDELSGMIFVKDDVPIIGINSLHHPNRQRFTIAHEIGHLVLHRNKIEQEVHVDTQFSGLMRGQKAGEGTDSIEIEANNFASELLMPESSINEDLGNSGIDLESDPLIDNLAEKYRVSKQAMQNRILRLID